MREAGDWYEDLKFLCDVNRESSGGDEFLYLRYIDRVNGDSRLEVFLRFAVRCGEKGFSSICLFFLSHCIVFGVTYLVW